MNNIALIILFGLFLITTAYFLWRYNKQVIDPVDKEICIPLSEIWQKFIITNIESCFLIEQCRICEHLIKLYDMNFKNHLPEDVYNDTLESMWAVLSKRYRSLVEPPMIYQQ